MRRVLCCRWHRNSFLLMSLFTPSLKAQFVLRVECKYTLLDFPSINSIISLLSSSSTLHQPNDKSFSARWIIHNEISLSCCDYIFQMTEKHFHNNIRHSSFPSCHYSANISISAAYSHAMAHTSLLLHIAPVPTQLITSFTQC